ncbi:MAG: MFS transporter [Bacillota bacterium]|nr:MFS transporter [Bacillota bacterium]
MLNIFLLGFVSFFVDISTEMVYPLIPLYLTSVFGATPVLVGIIEGIAESLASLLKVFSGYISDKYKKKKPIVFFGYSASLFYKLALILASSWAGILLARIIDRFGKGIRTAPRDLLVAENAKEGKLGSSYGIHKALDMAGSALGILLAYFLMKSYNGNYAYKQIFVLSAIPAVFGLIVILFINEKNAVKKDVQKIHLVSGFRQLDSRLKGFMLVIFLFTIGNSSNAFLLLRAQHVGYDATTVILLYFIYNFVSSILAIPLGRLSDKIGRRHLLVSGYFSFGLVYIGFAVCTQKIAILILFVIYGLYTAMTAGVERALVAEISPAELKGTVLGLYASISGIALLPASIIAGLLWDHLSPAAPFWFGGITALLSSILISIILKNNHSKVKANI